MNSYKLANYPRLARIVRAVAPYYRKHSVFVSTRADKVTMSGTYWDSGSRDTYTGLDLGTMTTLPQPHFDPPQFGGPKEDPIFPMKPGRVCVKTGIFNGKKATAHIYVHPDDIETLTKEG